jgi:hypothetical protein
VSGNAARQNRARNANPTGRPKKGTPLSPRTIREHAAADIRALARAEGEASLQLLIDVRDDKTAAKSLRLSAANSLLDRGYGTPRQSVEVTNDTVVHVTGDDLIERLKGRIDGIRERLKAQGVLPQLN